MADFPTSSINPLVAAGGEVASGIINNLAADVRAKKQRQWNEKMMDKQNEWTLNMWNKTNEYNEMKNQVARMQSAGLNPLAFNPDGSAAASTPAAAGVNSYERADTTGLSNPVMTAKQTELMNKQIDKLQSDIDKQNAERAGLILDNQFKSDTLSAREAGVNLANKMSEEQIKLVEKQRDDISASIKKKEAEVKTETARLGLIEADKWLKSASAQQIVELLPYHKLLMSADTTAKKAAAAASFANAAYQNGLISSGYIDKLCDNVAADIEQSKAGTRNQNAIAAVNEFKASVKNGNIFDTSNPDFKGDKFLGNLINGLFYDLNVIGETLTGGLAGVFK